MTSGPPAHISALLSDLRSSESPGALLLSHRAFLPGDTGLFNAYITLGFDHIAGAFRQPVQTQDAVTVLKKEYEGPAKAGQTKANSPIKIQHSPRLAFKWLNPSPLPSYPADDGEYDEGSASLMWGDEPDLFTRPENPLPPTSPSHTRVAGLLEVPLDPLNSRMNRGLKILSARVREVVKGEGSITYKQVADRLMKEEKEAETGSAKEEKNVRRRVYDALNVLIAAGMLRKQGKFISWRTEPMRKTTKRVKEASRQLQEQVQDLQAQVIAKADTLRDLVRRLTLLQALIGRNQGAGPGGEKLPFPVLLLATGDTFENSMTLISAPKGNRLTVKFYNEIRVLGDVDFIPMLGLSPVGLETVPKEVQRLLDAYKETTAWG